MVCEKNLTYNENLEYGQKYFVLPWCRVEHAAFPFQLQASAKFHQLRIFYVKNIYLPVMVHHQSCFRPGLKLVISVPGFLHCGVPL